MLTSVFLRLTYVGAEWVLWLLLLLSFISVALMIERVIYFYMHRVDNDELATQLQELLQAGDVRAAWELVQANDSFECGVVAAGLESLRKGTTACQEAMLSAKARLKPQLDARLSILATIGSNAPFIGLLGTVLGIIKAAHDLTADAGGNPNAVMAGVFEALVATAVGLFVAIPAVIGFNLLQRKVRTTIGQADSLAHLVLASVRPEPKSGAPAAPAASRPLVSDKVR